MAESTALVPFAPSVELLPARAPRRVTATVLSPGEVIDVPSPSRRGVGRRTRRTVQRRNTSRRRRSTRRRVPNYSRRRTRPSLFGLTARRGGKAKLSIGRIVIGIVVGVAAAVAMDAVVSRYLTKNLAYRSLILGGVNIAIWVLSASLAPSLRPFLQLFATTHAVSTVIVLGIDLAKGPQ